MPMSAWSQNPDALVAELRRGDAVAVLRHALAPGTFDPPGMRLDDCSSQRNLSDEGRLQAQRIGSWFSQRQLVPARVRSSPWCRCLDTARLAFGSTETWPALGSPAGSNDRSRREQTATLTSALASAAPAGFEVWITHSFVISALTGQSSDSGAGVLLRANAGQIQVVMPISVA